MSPSPTVTATWLRALAAFAIVFLPGGLIALFAFALVRAFFAARTRALAAAPGGPVTARQLLAKLTITEIWQQARSYFQLFFQIVNN